MAKTIRSIKADLCRDETLGQVSRDARLLFVGLITIADDHGRFRAHPALVRTAVFPFDVDLDNASVDGLLWDLEQAGRIRRYQAAGQTYGLIVNWARHQRVDNAARSEFPDPPDDSPADTCGDSPQPAATDGEPPPTAAGREGIGRERKGGEAERRTAAAAATRRRSDPPASLPLPDPWILTPARCDAAKQLGVDAQQEAAGFTAHYRSTGDRRVDWDQAWLVWCRRSARWARGQPHTEPPRPQPRDRSCPDCHGSGWLDTGAEPVVRCTCTQEAHAR